VKALVLDFDGVISDSAAEAFVVALRTWSALRPDSALAQSAAALEGAGLEAVRRHGLYDAFVSFMPLGNRAEDYALALGLIESGQEPRDQAGWDVYRASWSSEFLGLFHQRFYDERKALCERDREAWLALLGPYPEFVALLRRRAQNTRLALATAKDRRSVEILLGAYGIADLFAPDRIADKQAGENKRAHLRELRARLGLAFQDLTFVDDKVSHLDSVAALGVRCALAAWGYNGPRERRAARARGHLVCDLENAEDRLFEDSPIA